MLSRGWYLAQAAGWNAHYDNSSTGICNGNVATINVTLTVTGAVVLWHSVGCALIRVNGHYLELLPSPT